MRVEYKFSPKDNYRDNWEVWLIYINGAMSFRQKIGIGDTEAEVKKIAFDFMLILNEAWLDTSLLNE